MTPPVPVELTDVAVVPLPVVAAVVAADVVAAWVVLPVVVAPVLVAAVAPPALPLDGDVFGFVSLASHATRPSTVRRDAETTSPGARQCILQWSTTSTEDANNQRFKASRRLLSYLKGT